MVWYSHPLKNFLQFLVIHIVKDFGIVNKAEVDVFLELSCFFMSQRMLAIWSLVPLPFLNPAWTSGSLQFTYFWSFDSSSNSWIYFCCLSQTLKIVFFSLSNVGPCPRGNWCYQFGVCPSRSSSVYLKIQIYIYFVYFSLYKWYTLHCSTACFFIWQYT